MLYFDNAATSFPKPESVIKSIITANCCAANPGRGGYRLSVKSGHDIFEARLKISQLFSSKEECVIFTKNCTEALNLAIKGLVNRGDHIIISSLEHNSVLRPVERLKAEKEIEYSVFSVFPGNTEKTLSNLIEKIRNNTKLIVCTHVSNVFGTVLPIDEIAQVAHKYGALFVLDAAQSSGVFDINLKKNNYDVVCMPGHKGLYGPMGTGVMILSDNIRPEELIEGGTGSFSMDSFQPLSIPDRYESGTLNYPGIKGLSAGIDFILSQGGVRSIYEHEIELTDFLYDELKNIKGIIVYDKMISEVKAPIISFNIDKLTSEAVADFLDKENISVRSGFHCSYLAHKMYNSNSSGAVRISPGYFNTKKQIKFLCFCLNKIAKRNVL